MPERVKAWRCIGCGRIDGPQPCIGVCEDRAAELVDGADYDRLAAEHARAHHRIAELEGFLLRLASTRPRDGQWRDTYTAFQEQARRLLRSAGMHGRG